MTVSALLTLGVVGLALVALVRECLSPDIVLLTALGSVVLLG